METRKVAIILFYNKNREVLIQIREGSLIKYGEGYGYFGGKIEEDETPEQALKREMREELNINIKEFKFFKRYVQEFKEFNKIIDKSVFTAKMPDIKSLKVDEGKPFIVKFEDAFKLRMMPGDIEILKDIYEFLKSKNEI